jgi:hypothetical protein
MVWPPASADQANQLTGAATVSKAVTAASASGRTTIDGRAWRNMLMASCAVAACPLASRYAPTTAALRE